MTHPHEPLESIAERARRALRDNDEARLQAQLMASETKVQPESQAIRSEDRLSLSEARMEEAWRPTTEARVLAEQMHPGSTPGLVDRRMHAIHLVRELEPRRTCFRQRVHELQHRLSHTPTDSVHYAHLLARLAEAHGELNRLEAHIEEAQHVIRSTEWLMEMLTDPTRSWGRPAGEELDTRAR